MLRLSIMQMYFLLLLLYISLLSVAQVTGKFIICVCTTDHCKTQGTTTCNTTSMCYSQYLDRKDGSNPLVRGCITTKTPLLCENRRPAVHHVNWPVLVCCNTNMCNQDAFPTVPPWIGAPGHNNKPAQSKETPSAGDDDMNGNIFSNGSKSGYIVDNRASKSGKKPVTGEPETEPATGGAVTRQTGKNSDNRDNNNMPLVPSSTISGVSGSATPKMSSIYVAVLVAGVVSLVIIGVVALFLLTRRQSVDRLYDTSHYLGKHFKSHHSSTHHHRGSHEDPELQMPLPKAANGIYDNKLAVNT